MSVRDKSGKEIIDALIPALLEKTGEITLFLNPVADSYKRLGNSKAPAYISWSAQNRSQLIRIPAAIGEYKRLELRSPDPEANPYLAFALLIYAGLYGLKNNLPLPPPADVNFFTLDKAALAEFKRLPSTLEEAKVQAKASAFVQEHLPESLIDAYCR